MAGQRILFFVVLTLRVSDIFSQLDEEMDEHSIESQNNLPEVRWDDKSEFVVNSGYVFPKNSTWNESDDTFDRSCYERKKCLPLYCPVGSSIYLKINQDCEIKFYDSADYVKTLNYSSPFIYSIDNQRIRKVLVNASNLRMRAGNQKCDWLGNDVEIDEKSSGRSEYDFYLRKNGSIYLPRRNISEMYNFDGYCLCGNVSFRDYKPHCKYPKTSAKVGNKANYLGYNKEWFHFYLKLLIVMGIRNWYSRILSRL